MRHLTPTPHLCLTMRAIPLLLFCFAGMMLHAQEPCAVSLNSTAIGCQYESNGSLTVVATTPGLYTYAWAHDPLLTGPTATGLNAGIYAVVVSDTSGCVSFLEFELIDPEEPPLGTITVTNITCAGLNDGSVTFTPNPGIVNWSWLSAPGVTSFTRTGLGPEAYGVIIPNPPNCPSYVWAWLGDPDIVIQGSETYCPAAPPLLSTQLEWGFQPTSYLWSTGATTSTLQVTPGLQGTITVTATNSSTGCTASGELELTELSSPTVSFTAPDSLCEYAEALAEVLSSDAATLVWRWGSSGYSTASAPVVSFEDPYWQPISLQGFDADGCGNVPVRDSVYVSPTMPADFTVKQIPCSPMVEVVLQCGADSCAFFIGDSLALDQCEGRYVLDLKRYAEYDFTLYAVQASQCNDTAMTRIDVRTEPTLFLPTAFTPNDDGYNDLWPGPIDIPERGYELRIFNRSGTSIWSTTNTQDRWDGAGAPQGTYVYTMRMRDPCVSVKEVATNGYIILLR
jgi:gliding motility-associated-like protein